MFKRHVSKVIASVLAMICALNVFGIAAFDASAECTININPRRLLAGDGQYPVVDGYNLVVLNAKHLRDLNIYFWNKETGAEYEEWPGVSMRSCVNDLSNENQYYYYVPEEYDACVFNYSSGTLQSIDVDITGNMGVSFSEQENNKWTVDYWTPNFCQPDIIPEKLGGSVDVWPGLPMSKVENTDNTYFFDIPIEYDSFIFNDGNFYYGFNDGIAWQTEDILFTGEKIYTANLDDASYGLSCTYCSVDCSDYSDNEDISRRVYFEAPSNWKTPSCFCWASENYQIEQPVDVTVVTEPSDDDTITVYFENTYSWNNVYWHAWNDLGDSTEWPGEYMEDLGENIYKATIDDSYNGIIFNNGSGKNDVYNATGNLVIPGDGYMYCDGVWTCYFGDEPIYTPDNGIEAFSTYFANYLEPYYDKMVNVDMPCQTIISDGGSTLVTWNAFLLSLKSLPDFKLGVDEKSFYEAILFDLITDTVSSVDYEKEMKKQTMDMVNMLVDFLIDKGVDVSKENCSKADLDDMYTALSDYWVAKDIQMTKEIYDAFADGCNNAEDCIEKIGIYAVAMQQSQNLVEALKLMSKESEKDPNAKTLKSALDEMIDLMNMEPLECVNYVLDEKVIEMGTDAAVNVICNFALDTIKEVFPVDIVLDCIKVADWGSNLIYPTSLSSEQQYRIYALYHIEKIARSSFKTACNNYQTNQNELNANIVNSCYDMFVRIYEHEIIECEALAELIYKKGILNGIKNYFSSNSMDDYYFAVDWVKSYNANLEIMKNYKYNAYLSWGIAYDKLEPVIYVSVIDGKVVNYTVSGADVGSTVYFPDFSQANKIINRTKLKYIGDFEGWYYDEDCTSPCFANNAVANEPIVRYAKFSSRNGKKIQVKCPVNVEVYDSDNVLCLKIEDNKTVVDNGSLSVVITDSCKEIFVPDGQYYTINLTAFDDGVMNYSVTEINNSIATKRVNFYDVSLYDGQVYNGQVEPENNLSNGSYSLTTLSNNGETLVETADEELYQAEMQTLDIAVTVEGNGYASSGALVTKGDYVKLSATPDEAESFLGWYSNDNILSSECDFGFIAKESMDIVAKFTIDGQNSLETEATEPSTGGQDNPTEQTEPSTGSEDNPTDPSEPSTGGEDEPTEATTESTVVTDPIETTTESAVVTEPSTGDGTEPSDTAEPSTGDNTKPSKPFEDKDILGDVNGDGKVNIKDATMIQKDAAKIIELTDDEKLRADVNTDNKNNVKDATAIQKFVAKIETGFQIGEPIVSKVNN